jgi:pimeloyl-ACP methyl ester carboxylesterase
MNNVNSADGTPIAYEATGTGPAVILVTGALGVYSKAVHPGFHQLADLLAPQFTVINYDRRGRGESGDTQPYAVQREIEDIEALIDAVGGTAYLYGVSSGGALALESATSLPTKVTKLAIYEVPYVLDDSRPPLPEGYVQTVTDLSATGRRGDAVALFMTVVGVPDEYIPFMRQDPSWALMEEAAHTLAYDGKVIEDNMKGQALTEASTARWSTVACPALFMAGGNSEPFFRDTAQVLADILPNAEYQVVPGQDHAAEASALAPYLKAFFSK